MPELMNATAERRLEAYFDRIGAVLGRRKRREAFAIYAMGLLGDGERKSIEPIACRTCADPEKADAAHQRLLRFAKDSPWSDRNVRREAAQYGIDALTAREPINVWIVDDTGFLKQGTHSVGVQRQYTGSAGKIANCQIGVSLSVATPTEHLPIDFELYLPESWTSTPARRREARIPEEVTFKTKPEMALEMIQRAVDQGVPRGVLLADSAYGTSFEFREQIRALGLDYAVGVNPTTAVWLIDQPWSRDAAIGVRDLALTLHDRRDRRGFRRCTWREGTRSALSAKFAMLRVLPASEHGGPAREREPLWLLIEWRDGEPEPANYFLCSLPMRFSKKRLIRIVMQRWRTERVYEDLKGELGLDHFEGRSFVGWHHHVSIALCCYAFIVAERVRRFPPSAGMPLADHALSVQA
jgi:SRSO17 transposase